VTSVPERIQKVLARLGVGSRRQVEAWIREGRLGVNGAPAQIGAHIGPRDRVTLDGRPLRLREPDSDTRVVIYHRPARKGAGVVDDPDALTQPVRGSDTTSAADEGFDLQSRLPRRAGRRWMAVSPLPPNDSGLELLTSDGDLAQALMRKVSTLPIEFALRVRGEPTDEQLERLRSGIVDDDTHMQVQAVEAAGGEGFTRWVKLVARGGRARDVHRLCAAAGIELSRLMRVAIGPLRMDRSLARERLRSLKPHEVEKLRAAAGLADPEPKRKHMDKPARARGTRRPRADRSTARRRTGR
jgi:23S rRNA pseudouridine2605 synthase